MSQSYQELFPPKNMICIDYSTNIYLTNIPPPPPCYRGFSAPVESPSAWLKIKLHNMKWLNKWPQHKDVIFWWTVLGQGRQWSCQPKQTTLTHDAFHLQEIGSTLLLHPKKQNSLWTAITSGCTITTCDIVTTGYSHCIRAHTHNKITKAAHSISRVLFCVTDVQTK